MSHTSKHLGFKYVSGHLMGSGQQEKVSSQGTYCEESSSRLRGLKLLEVGKTYGNQKPLQAQGGNLKEMNTMVPAKPMSNSKLGDVIRVAEPTLDRKVVMSTRVLTKAVNDKKLEAQVQTVEPTMGQKDMSTVVPRKPVNDNKPEEARIGAAEPTMLMMKFPPETTLLSIPELKAKFVNFGPLHPSATRVFWGSSTCQVVFKYKRDAQEAHAFATQNSSFFGSPKVNYHLRAYELPASQLPESGKMVLENTFNLDPILKSTNVAASLTCHSSRIPNVQEHSEVGHWDKAPTMKYDPARCRL